MKPNKKIKLPPMKKAKKVSSVTTPKSPKPPKAPVAHNVYEGLLYFQKERVTIPRNGVGKSNSSTYKYATLDDTINTVRPLIEKYGLGFTQLLDGENLVTELFHAESGTKITSTAPLGKPTSSQDMGARITYIRRYTLTSILALSGDEDTDAKPVETIPDAPAKDLGKVSDTLNAPEKTQRSETFQKAIVAIEGAMSADALETLVGHVERSEKLTMEEKVELKAMIKTRETEVEGTVHA